MIYNYKEIRVESRSRQFISNSDTEVLLQSYISKEECLKKLIECFFLQFITEN